MRYLTAATISVTLCALGPHLPEASAAYTLRPTRLRAAPRARAKSLRMIDANATVDVLSPRTGAWLAVRTVSGTRGYVRRAVVADVAIEIFKQERTLVLLKNGKEHARYRAAFAPHRRLVDKLKLGDLATPEGRYFIAKLNKAPRKKRYGARSMRLSYPSTKDARRGVASHLISHRTYLGIVKAIRQGRLPDQRTPLGSSIRIHGGGSERDWTAGCIALDDQAAIAVFDQIRKGVRVDIYRSRSQKAQLAHKGYLASKVLAAAQAQLKNPALYTNGALGLLRIAFPGGDIRRDWAVCTDIIIRSLRGAGLDLQALIHEDVSTHKRRYRGLVNRISHQIDHRRARNIQRYLSHHSIVLPPRSGYLPGDIVLMDAIVGNGRPFDHIGIVDNQREKKGGLLRVINIWTVGWRTASMDLLGKDYPAITAHFRLPHPFDLPL